MSLALPDSIHFIQRDWLCSNQVVFFDHEQGTPIATVVDTGYATKAEHTLALIGHVLGARGLPITALRRIVNTHLHSDHCGGNARLAQASGAEIIVPIAERDTVAAWDEDRLTYRDTGQVCDRFHAAGALSPGDTLVLGGLTWQALAAPGHDPHSLILHCAERRLLISADALWENGFGIIFPELSGDSGFAEQQDVLELIATLPVDTVLPGHGAPFHDVAAAIDRARSRIRALREDPRRNARNAIKALIKFLMLECQSLTQQALIERCDQAGILHRSAAQLGLGLPAAIQQAVKDLLAQGQLAHGAHGTLVNAEPVA